MKAMVVLIISLLLISILTLFWPSNKPDVSSVSDNTSQNEVITDLMPEKATTMPLVTESDASGDRTQLMTAEYEVLETKRKSLKKRLSRLKHDMWGMKFEPEDAKTINQIILNAVNLNKNPHMLGAFSSVESIRDEVTKIEFAHKSLDHVNDIIEENKQQKSNEG